MKLFTFIFCCFLLVNGSAQTSSDSVSVVKSDRELIIGMWSFRSLKMKGEILNSTDEKEMQVVLDKAWEEQGEVFQQMGIDKDFLAKQMDEVSKKLAAVTFIFGDDGKVVISANDKATKDEVNTYTINETKRVITIFRNAEEMVKEEVYTYSFEKEQFILYQGEEELIFVRK